LKITADYQRASMKKIEKSIYARTASLVQ